MSEDQAEEPLRPLLTEAEESDFERRSRRKAFSRGDVILREGDRREEVMLLRTGRVKVCGRRSGREVILSIVDPGSLLGELSATDGAPHSANVIALEPVVLDAMGVGEFEAFLTSNPRVSTTLLRAGAARVRDLSDRQVEFATIDTLSRVCGVLLRLADRYGTETEGRVEIVTPLSQQELAEWSGMSREAFVKALARLRKLGWLSVENRMIVLLDPPAIKRKGGPR